VGNVLHIFTISKFKIQITQDISNSQHPHSKTHTYYYTAFIFVEELKF